MPRLNILQGRYPLIVLACLVAGCAAPPASPEMDARGKSFSVAQGKANIYLYRNDNLSAEALKVSVNGKDAGATARATYFLWEVEPGTYDISAGSGNSSNVHIVAEPGKSYYVWQEVELDRRLLLLDIVTTSSNLHVVDSNTGQWGVSECNRIQSLL
jgi:Protein of unknown function (DUF2846)